MTDMFFKIFPEHDSPVMLLVFGAIDKGNGFPVKLISELFDCAGVAVKLQEVALPEFLPF